MKRRGADDEKVMKEETVEDSMTQSVLNVENEAFRGRGGRSEENRSCGFLPAFMDTQTRQVYVSRFADGRLAPFHLLDGLPDEVVTARHASGSVASVKSSVVSGFVCGGRFFTRDEAAQHVERAA